MGSYFFVLESCQGYVVGETETELEAGTRKTPSWEDCYGDEVLLLENQRTEDGDSPKEQLASLAKIQPTRRESHKMESRSQSLKIKETTFPMLFFINQTKL